VVILQTEFENAGDFSEGLASFESGKDEKYGYINKKRYKVVIQAKLWEADKFQMV